MNIGFFGFGIMGCLMVFNFIKGGYMVIVWVCCVELMQLLFEVGVKVVGSLVEVVQGNELVILMVVDVLDVVEVMYVVVVSVEVGLVVIDMSIIVLVVVWKIVKELVVVGIDFFDVLVFGGEVGVIVGILLIMVGGLEVVFVKVLLVFECMGKNIVYVGVSGVGQVIKVVNQIVIGMGVLVVVEVYVFVVKNGVDCSKVCEVLFGGFVYLKIFENYGQCMLDCNFKLGFKSWMYEKDLNIVMQMVYEFGFCLFGLVVMVQMFNVMVGFGLGDEDFIVVLKLFEKLLGQE